MKKSRVGAAFVAFVVAGAPLVGMSGASAAGANWYVAPTGSDSNNCSAAATPCLTLKKAVSLAAAGDVIDVAAGTYNESESITKPVTIQGAGAATTTINAGASATAAASTFLINVAGTGAVNLSGLTITGGFNSFGGGIQMDGGVLTVASSTISGNSAGAGLKNAVGGGGIGVLGVGFGTTPQLILNQVSVTNNQTVASGSTGYSGAGIYILGSGPTIPDAITGSTISNNTVNTSGDGGGIYVSPSLTGVAASLTLDSTTVQGNAAPVGGGFASVNGTTVTLTNGTAVTGNTGVDGAGLFTSSTVNAPGAVVSNNTASFDGGGMYIAQIAATDAPSVSGSGLAVTGNTAAFGGGGALVLNKSSLSLTNGSLSQNSAPIGGGAYIQGGATGASSGTTISANTAKGGTLTVGGLGAGIFDSGSLSITNAATVSGNAVTASTTSGAITGYGGGVLVEPAANGDAPTATISGSTISANTASLGAGVAVVGDITGATGTLTPGALTDTGNTYTGNIAAVDGGGLFNDGASTTSGSTFNANTAAVEGGAIFVGSALAGDTPTLGATNLTITGDGTTQNAALGGGITVFPKATVTVNGGTISKQTALGGGGLFVFANGLATATGVTFSGDTATGTVANSGDGGAIFNEGTAVVTNSTLSGNKAVSDGIAASGSNITGDGGAVYAGSSTAISTTISGDTVTGNQAVTGAGLIQFSSSGTNVASVTNSTFTGNANSNAGTIVTFNTLSVTESTINANTGAAGSGGLYGLATVNLSGSILQGNGTANCGIGGGFVAPTDGGYNLTDAGDTSCGLTAATHDVTGSPQLGALANNGGPTQTELPGSSSPVIDVIPPGTSTGTVDAVTTAAITLCAAGATDQRGTTRPQGPTCDIGAVEANVVAPVLTGPATATYAVGAAGVPQTFTATGTPTPSLSESGALPSGVTFVDNHNGTATISGTPAAGTGGSYAVVITATNGITPDATLSFTLTVGQAPTISGPATVTLVAGSAGSASFTATGFPLPGVSEIGLLPAGVTFVDNHNGTATLSGTPTAAAVGTYSIRVTATNGVSPDATLAVRIQVNPNVSIATKSLPAGRVGVTYSTTLVAANGLSPYTWSITSGALPTGLSMSPAGVISGTPSGPVATAAFTVKLIDSLHPAGTAMATLSIVIQKGPTGLAVQPLVDQSGGAVVTTATARLTGGSPAVALSGQTVTFTAGSTKICSGITNASGVVTCSVSAANTLAVILHGSFTGTYAGSALWNSATGSAGVAK